MNQEERRVYLIRELFYEQPRYKNIEISKNYAEQRKLLRSHENDVKSIVFSCISTGVFMFPNECAAEIAVQTMQNYRREKNSRIEVVFNVWKDVDYEIYRELLE